MTEQQAWRIAAEAFDTPRDLRNIDQQDLTQLGLCSAVCDNVAFIYLLMRDVGDAMGCEKWWWPIRRRLKWTPDCDAERATFAGLMAAMTDEEREAFFDCEVTHAS